MAILMLGPSRSITRRVLGDTILNSIIRELTVVSPELSLLARIQALADDLQPPRDASLQPFDEPVRGKMDTLGDW
jgi:hypothetical protein